MFKARFIHLFLLIALLAALPGRTVQAAPESAFVDDFGKTDPAHGAILETLEPALSWESSAGAMEYEYCIDTTVNGLCDAEWISTGLDTQVALSNLNNDQTYSWQVRAIDPDETVYADEEDWWQFTIDIPQAPGAGFAARLLDNEVHAYGWPLGNSVTLTIDDPNTPQPVDHTDTETVVVADWDPNQTFAPFRVWDDNFELQPGQLITVTDQITTKTHTVTSLTVTDVDAAADTVSGTAEPGSLVEAGPIYCDEVTCYGLRRVTADSNGDWVADFAQPGSGPDEQHIVDLVAGTASEARQPDEDWDTTTVPWNVRTPHFDAWYVDGYINAMDWPFGAELTLEIEDPATPESPDFSMLTQVDGYADWDPSVTLGTFSLNGAFEIQPGMTLTISGASLTKELMVPNLTLTGVDLDADTITGGADPNSSMWMWFNSQTGTCCRDFQADENGVWTVDYSQPGANGEPVEDLRSGSGGTINVIDEDWDNTALNWNVPIPYVEANAKENWVFARDWPLGTEVTLTIDGANGPYTTTAIMQQAPWNPDGPTDILAPFDLQGYDIQPGDSLTATVGTEWKTLIISHLEITGFDLENDTLFGEATPDVQIEVCANALGSYVCRWATPDAGSNWSVDYSGEFDLKPGSMGSVSGREADGDQTWYYWRVPEPRMDVWYRDDNINAYDWPFDAHLTLEIDDPTTPASPDHSAETDVNGYTEWDPNLTLGSFDLNGVFDIEPGMTVTLSGAGITKELVISNLTITNINQETDIIAGGTEPDQVLWMWYNSPTPTCCRGFQADENGVWTVDYSEPGPNGEPVEDIRPGSSGTVNAIDEDGDNTSLNWNVLNQHIVANAQDDWIHAREWDFGTTVELTINGIPRGSAVLTDPAPWNPDVAYVSFDLGGYDVQVGDVITVEGSAITKQLIVSQLEVTDIDLAADTLSGVATPGADIVIAACHPIDGCIDSSATADSTSGVWTADLHENIDIVPGVYGWVQEWDSDVDSTEDSWVTLNYTLHAVPAHPEVHGHEWPLNTSVTLTIDNDDDPNNGVLYTQTKNVSDDPWCGEPCFDLQGVFTLEAGQYVTLTGSQATKKLQVSALNITEVNRATSTISGTAEPDSWVAVNVFSQDGLARSVQADSNGHWVADFSVPGDEDYEQSTGDLTYGDNGRAIQFSDLFTGDGTLEYWSIQPSLTTNTVGNGSISLDPPGGDYGVGTVVQLTAVADAGWMFAGWSGDLSGSANPASITMDSDKTVTATFTRIEYTLTLNTVGSGTLTPDLPGPYHYGDVVHLTAAPALGWSFSGWSGDASGTTNPLTVTITGNTSIAANFTQNEYSLTVLTSGNGAVTRDHPGPYHYGDVVQLTALPDAGWQFAGWSGAVMGTSNPVSVTMDGNKSVTATFTSGTQLIFADGFETGSLAGWSSCTVDGGDLSVTAAAKLAGNYGMQALLDDNVSIYCTSDHPNAEPRYLASFHFDPNSIAMVNGESHFIFGGYSGTSTQIIRVQFRRNSNAYQVRASVLTDGSTWRDSIWFTITDAPHLLELDWRAATAAGANNGELIFMIDGSTLASLTAVDNDTRRIDRVQLGAIASVDPGTRGTYYFDEFTSSRGGAPQPTFTLTVNKTGTGSGTVTSSPAGINCGSDCTEAYTSGTLMTLTATPAAGSTFTGWSGAGCSGTGTCAVTLTGDTSVTANFDQTPSTPVIFEDGFESGNSSAWSSCTVDGGDLSVTTAAKLAGNFGLQALLDDNVSIYCTSDHPTTEPHYLAGFSFDPNSISMANGDTHTIFGGYSGASTLVLRVQFRRSSSGYQLQASLLNDGSAWTSSNWITITDAPHEIKLDWRASGAAGANNGSLAFWVDGIQVSNLTAVDNDTRRIEHARLGAVLSVDTGTRGTYYLDQFTSSRGESGPVVVTADFSGAPTTGAAPLAVSFTNMSQPAASITGYLWDFGDGSISTATNPTHTYNASGVYSVSLTAFSAAGDDVELKTNYITVSTVTDVIFQNGFEACNLSAWSSSVTDSGDLSASPPAALAGTCGLQAVLDDNASIYVTDASPNGEARYRARFWFDPNSITMGSGDLHRIFYGYSGASNVALRLEFRRTAAGYELRAGLLNDGSSWVNSSWFAVTDAPHAIEFDWRAATAAGANNGGLTLWIDGVQKADLTAVDNDTLRIDEVRLGAVNGVDNGTRGTYFFDTFESRRQNYIGP